MTQDIRDLEPAALKPCPFCGCTDVSNNDNGHEQWFECDWCHATSGYDPAPEFEENPPSFHWNRRALSEPAAPAGATDRRTSIIRNSWLIEHGTSEQREHAISDLSAFAAAPAGAEAWRPTHRHVARGTDYELIGEAEAQVSKGTVEDLSFNPLFARVLRERDMLTIYRAKNGKLWARFPDEFHDGRFEALATPQPKAARDDEWGEAGG